MILREWRIRNTPGALYTMAMPPEPSSPRTTSPHQTLHLCCPLCDSSSAKRMEKNEMHQRPCRQEPSQAQATSNKETRRILTETSLLRPSSTYFRWPFGFDFLPNRSCGECPKWHGLGVRRERSLLRRTQGLLMVDKDVHRCFVECWW